MNNWRSFDIEFRQEVDEKESSIRCTGKYLLGTKESTRHFPGYPADPTEVEVERVWIDDVYQSEQQIDELLKDFFVYERIVKEVENSNKMMVHDFLVEEGHYASVCKDID